MDIIMILLHPGDRFPTLSVALPGGDSLSLRDALAGGFGVVLFYRGAWCPYCNAQLRAFQRASDSLAEVAAKVVAPFVDPERGFLQSTGFVLNPDAQVVVSVYSSGAIGRLVPDDAVGLIRYLRAHASPTD
jgi:thiol-disulfide isomerase/thioredoxin